MTNEQAKQEAIKSAYGDKWDMVKEFSDENGWILCSRFHYYQNINGMSEIPIINIFDLNDSVGLEIGNTYLYNDYGKKLRPISLRLIDDNGGWIRIEPDGSNLPNESSRFRVYDINEDYVLDCSWNNNEKEWHLGFYREIKGVTHYKPITPELKPIY